MKKILTIILVSFALSVFTMSLFAEDPQSMRAVATDNVFSGTWEDVYDPIDLGDINKFFFFTNLSDFNGEYNSLGDDLTPISRVKFLEKLPLGVAFENPFKENLKHAFFVRFHKNLSPSYSGQGYYGENEEFETEYMDVTGDDIYDIKVITHNENDNYYGDESSFDFIWNNNYTYGDYTMGLKLSSTSANSEIDDSSSQMGSYEFSNYDFQNGFYWGENSQGTTMEFYELDSEEYYLKLREDGDFSTTIKDNQKKVQFSMERENDFLVANTLLRYDLGLNTRRNASRDTDDDYYASYEEISLEDSISSTGVYEQNYTRRIKLNTNDLYLALQLKKDLPKAYEGRKFFWETGVTAGYIFGDRENYSSRTTEIEKEYINAPSSGIYVSDFSSFEDIVDESGDISGAHFDTHFLVNLPLNDYAAFGFGSYFNYSSTTGNYDYESEIMNLSVYQQGEEVDDMYDYTRTQQEHAKADKQSITNNSEFRVPIALEFRIPEAHTSNNDGFGLRNFVFRVGSTFQMTRHYIEDTYNSVERVPSQIITEYGDGSLSEAHDDSILLESSKNIRETIESTKRFSGGIGYQHSENVSIDLGGFYNYDTDHYYVGLSFTINKQNFELIELACLTIGWLFFIDM